MLTPEVRPDASLDSLAVEIREAHGLVEDSARSTVEHAIRAGELLLEAKGRVRHGEWLPWLEANFPASPRLAQSYMQIANAQTSADLESAGSVDEALALIATPREPEPEPDDAFAVRQRQQRAEHDAYMNPTGEGWDAPDDVQASIIAQTRNRDGEDAARDAAESMGVTYPDAEPEILDAEPVLDEEPGKRHDAPRLLRAVFGLEERASSFAAGIDLDSALTEASPDEIAQVRKSLEAARSAITRTLKQIGAAR